MACDGSSDDDGPGSPQDEAGLLRLAIESMAQGLFMLDANKRITILNQRFLDLYGLPPDIVKVGAMAYDIVEQSLLVGNYPGLSVETAWQNAVARFDSKQSWRVEQRLGNGRTMAIAFAPMANGGWVTTHLDVTEKRVAEDRLAFLAGHDVLTGLANRHLVTETLTPQMEGRCRFSLLAIDLDGFKAVNDDHGHAAGDEVLCQVAERLTAACPSDALVARMGGDEFLVQCGDRHAPTLAPSLAAAVIQSVQAPFRCNEATVQISASVGIAFAPTDGDTLDVLMSKADLALYVAKGAGPGACRIYAPDMSSPVPDRRRGDRRRA